MYKLNSLTLSQAVLLRDALELIDNDDSREDQVYLLRQLDSIIKNLEYDEKKTRINY